ncbi:expressed unknown protein [Seminavis robusta]|uniref:EGF-like domain-containing protein n=1 Tax=Seminavis robusta TaxID=568900 RepID=A0A9N8H920_9STRA|nr:expressed unknown protein [Seminavis robusta]|eukprot:Sro176_g077550.1 n/a (463) ;mRNA; r:88537-89925
MVFRLQIVHILGALGFLSTSFVDGHYTKFRNDVLQAAQQPACSLNGDLVEVLQPSFVHGVEGNHCICDKPWKGVDCGILDVLPVSFPQGYGMLPNKTTWGASLLHVSNQFHLFVSSITGDCSLRSWHPNSRIEHAVADTITGPYQFHDMVLPTFSHNPKVVVLSSQNQEDSDLQLAMFHIGDATGPDQAKKGDCKKQSTTPILDTATTNSRKLVDNDEMQETVGGKSSAIHLATSVHGPWTPLLNNTLIGCNNPAPFVHHPADNNEAQQDDSSSIDSGIYVVCGRANHSVLMYAQEIWGPWKTVSQITPFPEDDDTSTTSTSSSLHYEDPSLYIDPKRGAFHVIYHLYDTQENPPHGHDCVQSTVSAHVFSSDGIHWYKSQGQPYTTQIPVEDNDSATTTTTITVATRERPSLVFDPTTKALTHLITAVCSAENCPDGPPQGCVNCKYDHWDYTLVQPLNHA